LNNTFAVLNDMYLCEGRKRAKEREREREKEKESASDN